LSIPDRECIPDRGKGDLVTNTISESPKAIGNFVRTRRQASNLTQQELGELAGVGTRFISELERGKPTLRMDAINRVLRVFGAMLGHVDAPRDKGDE
jgi:y4mF family transcriptional regulator